MDHRATSIQFLRTTGLIPVKVRPNQKDPFPDWDPRRAIHEDHDATLRLLSDPNGRMNLGALFYGKWVDIDIDTNDTFLLSALDYFLPPTKYVWGRASKLRSHRVFCLDTEMDRAPVSHTLRFIKKLSVEDRSYSVEVRGGVPDNGLFAVLPGSTHPSGEAVEWSEEFDPSVSEVVVTLPSLIKSIRMAQAAAIIAPYWVKGMRNELCLSLSGLLWRIRATSLAVMGLDDEGEVDDNDFILRKDDARAIVESIPIVAGDDEADRKKVAATFNMTWKKLDLDPTSKVTGGKVTAEIIGGATGETILKYMYRLLSDNEGIEQLEDLCEQFCMWYGQGVLIDTRMVEMGMPVPWMNREQASNSLAGRKIRIGVKKSNIVNVLFNTSIIQRVAGLTFDPSTSDRMVSTPQGAMINQWRGFDLEPCPQSVKDDEIDPFLKYMFEVVADGSKKSYEWILDWCADLLQDPSNKPGTALVLVGPQGAGKTFLGEQVLGRIIGKSHYVQMNSIESLTSKFNQIADNKIFVQCDEAIHSYQRDIAAKLKSIITDESMTVEPKNVNAFKKPNHMHFLFTSNEEHTAIFIDPTPYERRFMVQKVSNARAGDIAYWEKIHEWLPMALPKIMRWLLDRRYDKKNVLRPLNTSAKRDIQQVSVDPEIGWIIAKITEGFPLSEETHKHWWYAYNSAHITANDERQDTLLRDVWPDIVSAVAIEADFKSFVRRHGRSVYSGNVFTSIKRAFPKDSIIVAAQRTVEYTDNKTNQLIRERIRLYSFPPVEKILEHLKDRFGGIVDTLIEEYSEQSGNEKTVSEKEGEF